MPPNSDLLACPICFEIFRDPVLLGDCGHSYCAQCVRALQSPLRCPTCRQPFTSRAVLPNFALRALLRERDEGGPSDGNAVAAAVGIPSGVPAESSSSGFLRRTLTRDVSDSGISVETLMSLGVPAGLAGLLRDENAAIASRIFLLDNSGSTSHPDGCVIEEHPDGSATRLPSTRWDEIKHMAISQAKWNLQLGTPCEFVLLNPAAQSDGLEEGLDFVRVDSKDKGGEAHVGALQRMLLATSPRGTTPLTERLRKIHRHIAPQALELARNGQKIVLVIVTDGLPTGTGYSQSASPEQQRLMVTELRRMASELPMHLVVRLCTDDDPVVDYYNSIDEEVELQLEVIDDLEGEAKEIYNNGNRWLVYSPLLHRIREGGTFMKVLDLVDERVLTPMEICLLCQLLLRQEPDERPLPSDPHEFCRSVRERLPSLPLVYDPRRKRMSPPVLIEEIEWVVLPDRMKRVCGGVINECVVQ